jgi:hypothetical protein
MLKRLLHTGRHVEENVAYRKACMWKIMLHTGRHVEENAAYRKAC